MNLKSLLQKYFPHLYITLWNKKFNERLAKNKALSNLSEEDRIAKLKEIYQRRMDKTLNLDNPITYTEKVQWLKLYDSTMEKTIWTDKIQAKELAAELIGEEYIVKLLHNGVKSLDEIDFSILPDKFVIKTNHGSGTYKIIKNKNKFLNSSEYYITKKRFEKFLQLDFGFDDAFELHYSAIEPLIFIEEYIEPQSKNYVEYSFLCFDGKTEYIRVKTVSDKDYINIYDLNWNLLDVKYGHEIYPQVAKPNNLDELINLSNKLCKDFSHVRVDFNVNKNKIYFGELTFTGTSGIFKIQPPEFDKILGDLIKLPLKN